MTIKVYTSGICGSQEVRKQQQRVIFILQSLPIDLQIIDVTDPGRDEDLTFMQEAAKKHDKKTQLPPQIFNENEYCGDYADFELANDDDEIMRFLKLEDSKSKAETITNTESEEIITQNGIENHEINQENPTNNEEPISNGINYADNETKKQESELVDDKTNEEETSNIEAPTNDDAEVIAEETKDEVSSKVEETTNRKESSEEESEEESE
ncbi:SH3 domain-binding glutamic acid-rich protein homolog [Nephila pilipes]|uniref:SH3 domain-binding glutamic acid-rich protein homolog n=1 Tax=Nephila pilipes TaxID=299642 RepID=A0A8X6NYP2_NEPPI|nr:SH3 domain-binding glutamic acid-rich protein homolog [Nephila pilipes]